MSVTFRRARAAALLARAKTLATVTACTGKNDGRRVGQPPSASSARAISPAVL